jgi:hypothetical protein
MRMIIEITRYLKASGFTITPPGGGSRFVPQSTPIYVRNDSGEEIPAFACLQTTGTTEAGGQNYITVDQPVDTDGTSGGYLFNGIAPIEIGGYGIAHDGPLCRMLTDGVPLNSGDKCQPVVGEWYIELGGDLITIVGDDDIQAAVVRGVIGSSGGGDEHFNFRTTGAMSSLSATASIYAIGGFTNVLSSQTVRSSLIFGDLPANTIGICILQGGQYHIVQAACPPEEEYL